ncbi:Cell division control protein 7 [Linderina macrospora]|uniref:Cell division control protein 7 n=1 Tax=Linderina macrospora TaxID=4868 RepID=A0ACC1JE87_9FUNG|nr:Cell division control protein 7 [Linderina macrospora]
MLPTKRYFGTATYTRETEVHRYSYCIPDGLQHEEVFTPEGIPIVQPVAKRPRLVFDFVGGLRHQDSSGFLTPGRVVLTLGKGKAVQKKTWVVDVNVFFVEESAASSALVDNDRLTRLLDSKCAQNVGGQAVDQPADASVDGQSGSAEDIIVQTTDIDDPTDSGIDKLSSETREELGCAETEHLDTQCALPKDEQQIELCGESDDSKDDMPEIGATVNEEPETQELEQAVKLCGESGESEVDLPEIDGTVSGELKTQGSEQVVELCGQSDSSEHGDGELVATNVVAVAESDPQDTEHECQQEAEQDRTHDTPAYSESQQGCIYTDTGGDTQDVDDGHRSEALEHANGEGEKREAAEGEGSDDDGEDGDDDGDDNISEEIEELTNLIPSLSDQYKLLGKIGEGTFSTVYKAIDLQHERYDNNSWEMIYDDAMTGDEVSGRFRRPGRRRRSHMVAIKKIYVTSSPTRIANEIAILNDLRGSRFVAPLVTAMRKDDQVVVVLPYFPNDDFRTFYTNLSIDDTRWYMASLLEALRFSHSRGIMHRDIKPSNFLYDIGRRHGVLVDFGLAEREDDQEAAKHRSRHALQMDSSTAARIFRSFDMRGRPGIPRKDTRPALRANRAGTRGFRAPEVLLKIAKQSVAIDIWSAGVIMLCFLTRRFPFFQSTDDTEALLEIAVLYGRLEMERAAVTLGRTFLTNIPTVKDRGIRFESLVKAYNPEGYPVMPPDAYDLLRKLLALTPETRITAAEALEHPFIKNRPVD